MKLLLSTICIALLALFAYQVMSYPLEDYSLQNKNADAVLAKSVDYELPKLSKLNNIENYSEIVQRPLFAIDRAAKVSAKVTNKVTTVNELSHLILVGTASSSDVQIAVVADTKAKQMERLKPGEKYNDWDIAEVSTDYVVFQNDDLEYKLFVAPIQGSQKDKRAKSLAGYDKSKIERAAKAINAYRGNNESSNSEEDGNLVADKPKRVSRKPWDYGSRSKSTSDSGKATKNNPVKQSKKKRSPIKIPGEEERDAAYYEGLSDDDSESADSRDRSIVSREITAEDFYNDEEISEEELKLLKGLGAELFDN